MPWQQHVFDVAFELDEDGRLFYGEVDNLAPRQQGKTAVTAPVAVHRLTALARSLGPQRLTYTAQTRAGARKKLERDFAEMLRASRSFKEIVNPKARPSKATEWKIALNNGSEHIRIGRSYWQIDAPSRTGTHGDTLDVGMIDEAFAHQSDDVEQAMKPAQSTRTSPQLWIYSTAGDAKSYYLWRKVLAGRQAVTKGEHGRVAYFEWSADDDDDPGDPVTWRRAMPALGFTVREEFVRAEWERAQRKGPEGVAMFRRAYLNQWPEIPVLDDAAHARVFPPGVWEAVNEATVEPPSSGLVFSVDVNSERTRSAIAVGSPGGSCALVAERSGVGWVIDELAGMAARTGAPVALVSRGPAGSLVADLERAGVTVLPVPPTDLATASGWLFDAVVDRRIVVQRDATLDAAVASAVKRPAGDAWVWDRRNGDVHPLVALTLAAWKAAQPAATAVRPVFAF